MCWTKRSSQFKICLTCANNFNKTDSEKWRNTCITETQNIILKIHVINFPIINDLYCWIYCSYILHEELTELAFCFILKLKITLFYFLSFVATGCTLSLFSLDSLYSIVVLNRCTHSLTCSHSLSLVVPHAVIRCHLFYHSLSFAVTCCTTCCDSTYLPRLFRFINCCFNIINRTKQCIIFCNTSFLPFVGTWTSDCCSKVLCRCFSF